MNMIFYKFAKFARRYIWKNRFSLDNNNLNIRKEVRSQPDKDIIQLNSMIKQQSGFVPITSKRYRYHFGYWKHYIWKKLFIDSYEIQITVEYYNSFLTESKTTSLYPIESEKNDIIKSKVYIRLKKIQSIWSIND